MQVLVDLALKVCYNQENNEVGRKDKLTFLDLCCGSGAIAVSLLRKNSNLIGYAIDQSEEAVALTEENAHRYGFVLCKLSKALSCKLSPHPPPPPPPGIKYRIVFTCTAVPLTNVLIYFTISWGCYLISSSAILPTFRRQTFHTYNQRSPSTYRV